MTFRSHDPKLTPLFFVMATSDEINYAVGTLPVVKADNITDDEEKP